MSRVSNKTRDEMWTEYDDTVNWSEHTHDDLLVCLSALQLSTILDMRDQFTRIIELLQKPAIQNASVVSLSHLSDERWEELQQFIMRLHEREHA